MVHSKTPQLLGSKKERGFKKDLLFFLELTKLYLSVGFDLSTAWELSQPSNQNEGNQTVFEELFRMEMSCCFKKYRIFFGILRQLYQQGGALIPALDTFCRIIRKDLEKDLEAQLRRLPTEANLLLIVFFIPPALFLLLMPFLFHFQNL